MFIQDPIPVPDLIFCTHTGSLGQKGTGSRIPDPQHCILQHIFLTSSHCILSSFRCNSLHGLVAAVSEHHLYSCIRNFLHKKYNNTGTWVYYSKARCPVSGLTTAADTVDSGCSAWSTRTCSTANRRAEFISQELKQRYIKEKFIHTDSDLWFKMFTSLGSPLEMFTFFRKKNA